MNLKLIAPRAMATFGAIIVFYLIFNSHIKNPKILASLSLVSAMYLVLVHPAQQLFILIILLIICIGSLLYFKKFIIGNRIVYIIVILLSLLYITLSYLSNVLGIIDSRFFSEIEMGNVNTVNEVITGNEIGFFINNLAPAFLLLFMFLGLFVLLAKISLNKKVVILIPLLSITFLFYIPGIADMFPFISQSLQFYRFQFPLSVFFAILMGIGCVALINLLYENKSVRKISLVLPIILCILIVISSLFVGYDADNNAIFIDTDVTSRLYAHFDEGDLYLFDNIQNYIESGSLLYTDFSLYKYYFKNPSVQILGQSYYDYADNFQELFQMNVNVEDRSYVIFRSQAYYETRLTVSTGDQQTYIDPSYLSTYQFEENVFLLNTIYDNDEGTIYTRGIV
ncbi:MAG: hypothetical protein M0P99_04155 [Candidatus Cloacimonetes bacterium]|nr:hypothetical protein [Candidatus Cloacimonadota bacterium]MCK9309443.1 hypothetical protein [Candidatus Cloacimonadota bacterium]